MIGGDGRDPAGSLRSAGALLAAMAEVGHGIPNVGVGAYPDTHPFIDRERLMEVLLAKQPMATYMVTQMCFDAGTIARWLGEVRGRGVALPVHLGIPGVLKRRKLLEISLRVGVGDSARYITKHAGIVARLDPPGRLPPRRAAACRWPASWRTLPTASRDCTSTRSTRFARPSAGARRPCGRTAGRR